MATVLILCPTFDHADTLFASLSSVRTQQFTDWELVVIGDGAPARTGAVMEAICEADPRIRYEWHPKSARYGEPHRDAVIRNSAAEFVCQIGDDDLWAPDHLDTMIGLLESADWANQAPLRVLPDGTAEWWPVNHGTAGLRASITSGVPVSAGPNFVTYRRDTYLRLPEGWTCAPSDSPSDAFMWAKFFRLPRLRVASTAATTAIKFPSSVTTRAHRTAEQRLAEIAPWLAQIAQPGLIDRLRINATIHDRMLSLYAIHRVETAASWLEAAARAGLQPVSADTPALPAVDGSPMLLPLSAAQQHEAENAWHTWRATC